MFPVSISWFSGRLFACRLSKQEDHGPHCSPEKQFQSLYTLAQSYYYTIRLIKRGKSLSPLWELNGPLFVNQLSPLHKRMICAKLVSNCSSRLRKSILKIHYCTLGISALSLLRKNEGPFNCPNFNSLYKRMLCVKFGLNGPSGSGEVDKNVKNL